jgi:hypothetical protein
MGTRALLAGALAAAALAAVAAAPAAAKDPGRWGIARVTEVPFEYFQGVAASPRGAFFFTGTNGLYGTTGGSLRETGRHDVEIPADVQQAEGYDHVGDLAYDPGQGGRLLLPLECYNVGRQPPNHCGTGSIAVVDPRTLHWQYYVKLDPAQIKKVPWTEVSPDGRSLYVEDERDLLRYDLSQISPANAAPGGAQPLPAQRVRNAFPDSEATGAAFYRGRLFSAHYRGPLFQLWSLDPTTGRRRLEFERVVGGESEGLAALRARGGELHWLINPRALGRDPTFSDGRHSAVVTLRPR